MSRILTCIRPGVHPFTQGSKRLEVLLYHVLSHSSRLQRIAHETYVKVSGRWCYLYRGIDKDGNLVDVRLSKTRDMDGTKAFFERALEIAEDVPDQVFTDGLASYPRAIDEELSEDVKHQVIGCQGNPVEQSHRRQKYRYYPTLGFGAFDSGQRFCQAYDEVSNFLRLRQRMGEFVSLSDRRKKFIKGVEELEVIFHIA